MKLKGLVQIVLAALVVDIVGIVALLVYAESTATVDLSERAGIRTTVVLYADDSRLGVATRRRLEAALMVARSNTRFLAVGGARPDIMYWGACEMRDWLIDSGVRPDRIDVDLASFDTITNIQAVDSHFSRSEELPAAIVADSLQALRVRYLVNQYEVIGLPLVQGHLDELPYALYRAQSDIIAWAALFLLPRGLQIDLLARVRANSGWPLSEAVAPGDACPISP